MTKNLLLLFILLPFLASAQEGSGYGLKIGTSFSTLQFKHEKFSKKGSTKLSPTVGLIAYAIITEKVRLCTDFSYSQINSDYSDTVTIYPNNDPWATPELANITDRIKLHQLEWFIMPEYRITEHFFVKAGATLNLVMARTIKDKKGFFNDESPTAAGKALIQSKDRAFNGGVVAGIGYSIYSFRFDVRYIKGLTNLLKEDEENLFTSGFKSAKYSAIQLSAAYVFSK